MANNQSIRSRFSNIGLSREKDYFIENLIILLDSGMGILEALSAIRAGTRSGRMRDIIDNIIEDIQTGSSLWESLVKTNLFPQKYLSLISIGEEAGKLNENLRVISLQRQKEKFFSQKIRSATMYPVMVLTLTIIIGSGMAWFLLPKLAGIFNQLEMELPPLTKFVIGMGNFFGAYGYIVFPLFFLLLALMVIFFFVLPGSRFIGQIILFRIPVIRRIIQETEISRFGYILGTLLDSGIPVVNALHSLYKVTSFYHYRRLYYYLKTSIEEGNSFQKSFVIYPGVDRLIPIPIQQMILAGEKSGRLSAILLKAGEIFESKLDNTTKNLTILLEPILLIIVWVAVMILGLAVVTPIYSLIGNLN